jgi:hypothetical protein
MCPQVMKFLVHPGEVLTKATIPEEQSQWGTLISEKLTVEKEVNEKTDAVVRVTVYAAEDEGISGFDLSLNNKTYAAGDPFVVHAIGLPLIPAGVEIELNDDGPPGGGPEPAAPVTPADLADCRRLLDAASVGYAGATVVCPVNRGLQVLAWALKFATVDDLLADLAKPGTVNLAVVQKVGGFSGLNQAQGGV